MKRKNEEVTVEDVNYYTEEWEKTVQWKKVEEAVSSFPEQDKAEWAIKNGLGDEMTLAQVLKDKHRSYYYATWQ